jgi:uncharacterized membrane protein
MAALREALRRPSVDAEEIVAPSTRRIALAGILSLIGLGIGVYLTIVHYEGTQLLACANNSFLNCQKVQTSSYSWFPPTSSLHPGFLHLPVAVLGLGYYVVVVGFNTPWAWRSQDRRVHLARFALAVLGIGFALYLVFAEVVEIGAICEWCTGEHLITFLLFIVILGSVPSMLGWGSAAAVEYWEDDEDEADDDVGDERDEEG